MLTISNIKLKLKDSKSILIQKYHINTIAIFGSVSRIKQTEQSDIDILVDFKQPIGIEFIDLGRIRTNSES